MMTQRKQTTTTTYSYKEIISVISRAASNVRANMTKPLPARRVGSATYEAKYIAQLRDAIHKLRKDFRIEVPSSDRHWYDVRIEGLAINIKITNGKSPNNALNKQGIIMSITGSTACCDRARISWNTMMRELSKKWRDRRNRNRDPMKEYHYLVVDKTLKRETMLRSILDVTHFVPNSANVLQINWGKEWKQPNYVTPRNKVQQVREKIIDTIQQSLRADIDSKSGFANADFART